MTTQQVADRLVELCRGGKIFEAQTELFSADILSIEPDKSPVKTAKGTQAVTEKAKQFASMIEAVHGGHYTEPIVEGNFFTVGWSHDATLKGMGRVNLEEICVYEVRDGKIVLEHFFY